MLPPHRSWTWDSGSASRAARRCSGWAPTLHTPASERMTTTMVSYNRNTEPGYVQYLRRKRTGRHDIRHFFSMTSIFRFNASREVVGQTCLFREERCNASFCSAL